MQIFCCCCQVKVLSEKVCGCEIYTHRDDLNHLYFYRCNTCLNYVGACKRNGRPLGTIATPEIRQQRAEIHSVLDPLWRCGLIKRGELYKLLSERLGYTYHTGNINTMEEALKVYVALREIESEL